MELLEGRELLSADPLTQAVTAGSSPAAVQAGSAIGGAPLAPSGDTDGSGDLAGIFSGNSAGISFTGDISGGLSGTFNGRSDINGDFTSSGSLSDGSTYTADGTASYNISGGIITGTFHGSGTASDGDAVIYNGSFSGTIDGGGNITGNFTGTLSANDDVWEPVAGGDYLWSDYKNWSAGVVPVNGATATFDGEFNSQCIVDVATTQGTIILQNGFTAPFEVQGGSAALDIPAFQDNDIPADAFNVNFLAANAPVNIDGVVEQPGKVDYGTGGKVNVINGGTLTLGIGANVAQSSGSPINVTNGQLNFGDGKNSGKYSTFNLTTASADINIQANGSLTLYHTGTALIDNSANPGAVISNNGKATLQGVAGAGNTTISVPLQNHGTLNVTGGSWSFDLKDASGNDLSMDAGSINLNNNATVACAHNYVQTGGVFNIMDATETFNALLGAVNFNGGTVKFTNTGKGTLNTNDIVFNGGSLNERIWGNNTDSDLINCQNSCTIQGNSTITVTLVGQATSQMPWTLIQLPAGKNIMGDFKTINLPVGIIEDTPFTNTWSCSVT